MLSLFKYLYKVFGPSEIEKVYRIINKYKIREDEYQINKDLSIDLYTEQIDIDSGGHFQVSNLMSDILNGKIRVNKIEGNFRYYKIYDTGLIKNTPRIVENDFNCSGLGLKSLEIGTDYTGSDFDCRNNNLKSLSGCPSYIGGNLHCEYNNIRTFEGFPKHLGGEFCAQGNPIFEIWRLFDDKSKIELFNDYDIIRDDNTIILDRLNDFLIEIGKKKIGINIIVNVLKSYNCI